MRKDSTFAILLMPLVLLLSLKANAEGTPSFWKNYTGLALTDESGGYVVNFNFSPANGAYPSSTYNSDSLNRVYVQIDFKADLKLVVRNGLGQSIRQFNSQGFETITLSDLAPGVYFLQAEGSKTIEPIRFVITR